MSIYVLAKQRPLDCPDCLETGFLYVKDRESPVFIYVLCDCKFGLHNIGQFALPSWSREMGQFYSAEKFPEEQFKPESPDVDLGKHVWNTWEYFKEKLSHSEHFWRGQIDSAKGRL